MSHRFSIIVPLYNKAPYIRKALESIVAQTYGDWECIVVDDGSTDGSADVVRDFIHELQIAERRLKNGNQIDNRWIDDRLTIVNQKKAGVAAARNNGVKESSGEYVCFLDADDWWESTYLEEMDKLIREYPDVGLYGCDYYYVKNGKKKIWQKKAEGYIDYCKVYTDCKAMPIHPNGAIIPRKVFDEVGGFDTRIKMGEDFILFMQIVMRYKVAFLNKQLVNFSQDADPKWRAITKLHKPEEHMLFNLAPLEEEINNRRLKIEDRRLKIDVRREEWKRMIDWLRVTGLLEYWLSDEYHDAALAELSKVNWNKQPQKVKRMYKMPIWMQKAKRRFMQIGSYCKQKLIHIIH